MPIADVLRRLPSARPVLIDCMRKASNLEALGALTQLDAFALGVYELQEREIDIVAGLPGLRALSLNGMKKSCVIGFISAMKDLRELNIFLGGRASISDLTPPILERLRVVRVLALADIGDMGHYQPGPPTGEITV